MKVLKTFEVFKTFNEDSLKRQTKSKKSFSKKQERFIQREEIRKKNNCNFVIKKFRKSHEWNFQKLRTFIFHLNIALKLFCKAHPMSKLFSKKLSRLYLGFPENNFRFQNLQTFASQKYTQTSLKTIFQDRPWFKALKCLPCFPRKCFRT